MTNSPDQQFVDQIARNPADTKLRLIYADWLEEHGDPRGEFIRVCEQAQGLEVWSDRYQQLKTPIARLRREVDPVWAQRLGYQPTYRPLFTKLPASLSARLQLLIEYTGLWLPEIADTSREEQQLKELEALIGRRVPAIFREFYLRTVLPHPYAQAVELRISRSSDGIIRFAIWDNVSFVEHGFRAGRKDPPVFRFDDGYRANMRDSLSTFLLKAIFAHLTINGVSVFAGSPSQAHLNELRQELKECDWSQRRNLENVEFLEGTDICATITEGIHLEVSMLRESALDIFSESLRKTLRELS